MEGGVGAGKGGRELGLICGKRAGTSGVYREGLKMLLRGVKRVIEVLICNCEITRKVA